MKVYPLMVSLDNDGRYGSCEVRLGDVIVGYRAYDGSDLDEIAYDVNKALAEMLNERLGLPKKDPDGEEDEDG